MCTIDYFPTDYADGRAKFRTAAEQAGAELRTYDAGAREPDGTSLTTDVALLGSRDAPHLFLCNSATHGVEGSAGPEFSRVFSTAERWQASRQMYA